MGKEGINILNDVVYITASIMGSIEGKSREYYAIRAAVLVHSAQIPPSPDGRLPPMA
jgi:hypothetical protein